MGCTCKWGVLPPKNMGTVQVLQSLGKRNQKHSNCRHSVFKHRHTNARSKQTDAIVDATMHLAWVLKGGTESNKGEKSIAQLQWLVDTINNRGIIKQDAWAEQKSDTIHQTYEQMRVTQEQKRKHNIQDLPPSTSWSTTTTEPQKILASTTDPPVVTFPPKTDIVASPPWAPTSPLIHNPRGQIHWTFFRQNSHWHQS